MKSLSHRQSSSIVALLLPLLTSPLPAGADDAPLLDEIIRKHVEARGGQTRIKAIRALVYSNGVYREGDYTGSGNSFMAFARPYFRVVGNPESPGSYMEGYDGAAWEWFADPGIVVRTVGAAAGAMRHGADLEGPLVDHEQKDISVRLAEPTTLDMRPVHRVIVTLRDGFEREYWIDAESYLVVAEKRTAPIHAFGDPVTSLTRLEDYRPVEGVLFAHRYVEFEIATGERLSSMQWSKIEAHRELPRAWFSPPAFDRTPLQDFLEHLYVQRTDRSAITWSYAEFRRAYPHVDTRDGVELIGYQILKMGEVDQAITLLEANARDYPNSASSAFGLGRAYLSAGRTGDASAQFKRALRLDPNDSRAKRALANLGDG